MSSFGSKRKARVIKIDDEEENSSTVPGVIADTSSGTEESSKPLFGSKSGRKPFRQSGLRKSLHIADSEGLDNGHLTQIDDEENDGPVVVRPNVSRTSSKQKKKPTKSSRLSFAGAGNEDADAEPTEVSKPKVASLGQRILESNALKRGIGNRGLPLRSLQDEDDDRPRYSKEYLDELQSSTPNTPQNVASLPDAGDEMELDSSELDGALVVESKDVAVPENTQTTILTEAEIKEKKERRARLAKEQNFISLDDEDEDSFGRKKKDDTRLVAEDEDLGEGFDDYVDDGGLSLGKRAEKERRKRERQQMAEMIHAAEGHSSDSSADSDAERRIAYEAAQTRAGMDGLKKPRKDPASELLQVPPKITPLPSLAECLAKLQATLQSMESEIKKKDVRVQQLRDEKAEVAKREGEVQALLDETGKKYQEALGSGKIEPGSVAASASSIDLVGERGLESLGATPRTVSQNAEDELMM
ncbi:hypothetical protein HJFPF1_01667 [Paramyrothecium foliicola]|nr:hypothetical protein HJFPF1_01667 [Paramyrothecium foliicola]